MDLTALQHIPERCPINPQVIPRGGLDVPMSSQLLDEHDVGSMMEQAGTKRMAQEVWRQLLLDTAALPQPPEQLGHVIPAQPTGACPCGRE